MKTYKLIKKYPGSPQLGTIRNPQTPHNLYEVCIEQPEFWEEAAEEYILMNKSCLSINDIVSNTSFKFMTVVNELKEKVKSKL